MPQLLTFHYQKTGKKLRTSIRPIDDITSPAIGQRLRRKRQSLLNLIFVFLIYSKLLVIEENSFQRKKTTENIT